MAHNALWTVLRDRDRELGLNDGAIVEIDTHAELLAQDRNYADLYRHYAAA